MFIWTTKKKDKNKKVSAKDFKGIELGLPRPEANTIAALEVFNRHKLPEISNFS